MLVRLVTEEEILLEVIRHVISILKKGFNELYDKNSIIKAETMTLKASIENFVQPRSTRVKNIRLIT